MTPKVLTFLLALGAALAGTAQQPATPPAASQQDPKASDPLRRAFVEASVDRVTIYSAANRLLKGEKEDRARFMAGLHAAKAKAGTGGAEAPAEVTEEVRAAMADAVLGAAEQAAAAQAKLAARPDGAALFARLHARGTEILERCLLSSVRAKVATNAIYAGQFDELAEFQPEAAQFLWGWAKEAPKGSQPGFSAACVRALRDLLPADAGTDEMRQNLTAIVQAAQRANDQDLFLAAVCALHQFGDTGPFDRLRDTAAKQAQSESAEQKLSAINTLADLHYQLRRYDVAATHFRTLIDELEKAGQTPAGLSTVCYNAACSLALAGEKDDAFAYLEKALEAGAKSRQLSQAMLDEDHDTLSLKSDPRYAALLEKYFKAKGGAK